MSNNTCIKLDPDKDPQSEDEDSVAIFSDFNNLTHGTDQGNDNLPGPPTIYESLGTALCCAPVEVYSLITLLLSGNSSITWFIKSMNHREDHN